MFTSLSLNILHQVTSWLLEPVTWGLVLFILLALYESGMALGERFSLIRKLVARKQKQQLILQAKKRIERADFITRIGPMLGLMGTLIPLGPGLAALGEGQLAILTTAMTVAFDTTVIGLLVGMVGFVLGRLRRRWYDNAVEAIESDGLVPDLAGQKRAYE